MFTGGYFGGTMYYFFCERTSKYPPAQIYAGVHTPTAKQKKEEQRVIAICEELYSLESPHLPALRAAWREVLICDSFINNVKEMYVVDKVAEFAAHLHHCCKLMDAMFKKEPVLVSYYGSWRLNQEFRDWVFVMLCDKLPHIDKEVVATRYKDVYSKTIKQLKEK